MSPRISIRLLPRQSDRRLLELVGRGDERAFETVVERYRPALLRYCRRLGLDEPAAEDAVQQSFTNAWLALSGGEQVRDLRPWLYRIAHNTALNALRGRHEAAAALSDAHVTGVAAAAPRSIDAGIRAREALGRVAALPEMQRDAVVLTAIQGRSHEEAAGVLGVSDGAVRGLLYRARAALRGAAAAIAPPWLLQRVSSGSSAVATAGGDLPAAGGALGLGAGVTKLGALAAGAGLLAAGVAGIAARPRSTAHPAHRGARVAAHVPEEARPAPAALLTSAAVGGSRASKRLPSVTGVRAGVRRRGHRQEVHRLRDRGPGGAGSVSFRDGLRAGAPASLQRHDDGREAGDRTSLRDGGGSREGGSSPPGDVGGGSLASPPGDGGSSGSEISGSGSGGSGGGGQPTAAPQEGSDGSGPSSAAGSDGGESGGSDGGGQWTASGDQNGRERG